MLVYAKQAGPRLIYTVSFISKEIFRGEVHLITDRNEYDNYNGPKINYSNHKISVSEFWISNTSLLFESGTRAQSIDCFEHHGNKAFFKVQQGDYSFDLFAAVFYLLSRYEEYLPHYKDNYGRYSHTNSLAYQQCFLHLPLLNIWLNDFKKALSAKFPSILFRKRHFTYQPTYDIDIAWSFRNKGLLRNAAGLIKLLIQLNLVACFNRIKVLCGLEEDPFDSYSWLHSVHKQINEKPIYFFLLTRKQKGYDKNISPYKKGLRELIKEHDLLYTTGIHPSWQSGDNAVLLEREINILKELLDHEIIHSRQHYLRFSLPLTYQQLINLGIQNEYSMGYSAINGFRASVASSYYWYDLQNESATQLLIHPFCFMDATAYHQLRQSPSDALKQLLEFYKVIKEVDGVMITIFHNNFLGSDPKFAGWREAYESFLRGLAGNGTS